MMKICWRKHERLYYRGNNKALRAAVMDMAIIPMIAFFFKKGSIHVDAVCKYLPVDSIEGSSNPDDLLEEDQTKIMRKPDVKEPFAALAFKILHPFFNFVFPCLFRTFRCRFLCLEHVGKERTEYTGTSRTQSIIEVILDAVGLKISTGDTLCDENIQLSSKVKFPA
jgi:elongation factor G